MKIVGVDVWNVVVPTIPGTVHSPEFGPPVFDEAPIHIIRLKTDEGIDGLGETHRGTPRSAVDAAIERVIGLDPLKVSLQSLPLGPPPPSVRYPGRDWEVLSTTGTGGGAYDAFECAFYDLVGKALGVPVHFLLGGRFRNRVEADYWIGQQTPEDAARNARIGYERGFHGMKMKAAIDDPWMDRIAAILEATGPEFKITIDPNQRFYRPHEAISLARRLTQFPNVALYEDPLPKWNLDWYKQLRAVSPVPIALNLDHPHNVVNAIKAEACDCMNLGSNMTGFLRLAAIAEAAGLACWRSSGNNLGIMEHAYLHCAAAARNCVLPSDFVGSWTREDDLVNEGIQFDQGCALVPDAPGLGCTLDFTALEKYRVQ